MRHCSSTRSPFTRLACRLLAASLVVPALRAQFTPTGAGPFDYNTTGNWTGGSINGGFSATPTAAQVVTFGANSTLTTGLTFGLGGMSPSLTLRGDGTDRKITLAGNVAVTGTTSTVVFGSPTAGNKLEIDLGGADRTFAVATGNQLTVNNAVGGGQALTKTGAGNLTLAGANSYAGATTVNEGLLSLITSGALASGNNVVINATTAASLATLALGAGFTQTIGTLAFGGAGGAAASNNLTLNAGSTLTLGGTVSYAGTNGPLASTIAGGTLALGGHRIFDVSDSTGTTNELNIASAITGAGHSLTKTGTGRLVLNSSANTYDGGTIVNGGELLLNASNTLAATGALTVSNTAGPNSSVILGANVTQTIGALTFGGGGASTASDDDIFLNTGSTLKLGGTVAADATNRTSLRAMISGGGTLDLGGNRTFTIANSSNPKTELTVGAVISGVGNSLTKTGPGVLRLNGDNTYSGGTIVSAGGLMVGNTTGSGVGPGALTIQSGAFLGGQGFVGGATTIEPGGTLGAGKTPGNLTFTHGLTLNDGAVFNFQLGTTSDRLTVTGGVLTGAATPGSLILNLTAGAGFGAGVYTLFDFSSGGVTTSSFDVGDFTLGTTIGGYTHHLDLAGNRLQLTTASAIPEPSTYAAIFGAVSLVAAAIYRRRQRPAAQVN